MIKVICLSFLLSFSLISVGQINKFKKIDLHSKSISGRLNDISSISQKLTKGLNNDYEKARAIYIWVAHNIKYDYRNRNQGVSYFDEQEIVDKTLRRRVGVCFHYSLLFESLCKSAGIEVYKIGGYTYQSNKVNDRIGHMWNLVIIDSKPFFVDVTWASGYEMDGKYYNQFRDEYFLIPPEIFIKTHMPLDPLFQMLQRPISHKEFYNRDFSALSKQKKNYQMQIDSLRQFSKLEPLDFYESEIKRIEKAGIPNIITRDWLVSLQGQVVTVKLNLSVDLINESVKEYNNYINAKNNQFRKMSDEEVSFLLNKASMNINKAQELLSDVEIYEEDRESRRSFKETANKVFKVRESIEKEKAFLSVYLKRSGKSRKMLFYKRVN
ncbi:MAG: transglutaminase domain-containing protein [Hyphomicrobiales bacterium]